MRNDSCEALAETFRLEDVSGNLDGERGDSTVTNGGDIGGDIGPMDTGRSFGVPERDKLSPIFVFPALCRKLWFGGIVGAGLLLGMSKDAPRLNESTWLGPIPRVLRVGGRLGEGWAG
jgi:hypothetical protein